MEFLADPPSSSESRSPVIGGRPVEWTLRDIFFGGLWFIGLLFLFPIPFVLPFLGVWGEDSEQYFVATLVAGAFSELGLIVVAAWFTFRKYGGGWERLGFARPTWGTIGWAFAAIAVAIGFNVLYTQVIEIFDIGALKTACDDQVPKELQDSTVALVVASIVFVTFAPVCEEIFFRGFLFTGLWRAFGLVIAALASGLLFSGAHVGPNIHKTIIPIFVIGTVFAFTYWKSGNILSTILAHFMQNALAVSLLWTTNCDSS